MAALALPGAAISVGLGEIWTVVGITLGIIASWYLIAERLRIETEKYNALTIPGYLHKKYNDQSNIIGLFSSVIIAFFFLFYVSAQFHASGKVINTLFGLSSINGIILGAIVIILYTLEIFAIAWTDLLQGILSWNIGYIAYRWNCGITESDRTIYKYLTKLVNQNHLLPWEKVVLRQ